MKQIERIEVLGDSILKGIQVNPENKRYYTKNDFNINKLSSMYSLTITNDSRFGCTVTKGSQLISKKLEKGMAFDAIVMDFGGNDCDYKWEEIAANPSGDFKPNTPLDLFVAEYTKLIKTIKNNHIVPILTTLPPLEPQRFFDWWCQNLNKENVMKWLGSIKTIYNHQAMYSSCVEEIARKENVPLVDIRSAFLKNDHVENLICEDGTHPNSNGQKVITEAFQEFFHKNLRQAPPQQSDIPLTSCLLS
jgi:lysophospholipase L1-like esterase